MKGMIQKITRGLLMVPVVALMLSFASPLLTQTPVLALTGAGGIKEGSNAAQGKDQPTDLFGGDTSIFKKITNVLLFVIGAVAVIMLIIGGIRYVISQGDSTAVTAAKNTILYAVIGIVVAILAYALVNFVVTSFAN